MHNLGDASATRPDLLAMQPKKKYQIIYTRKRAHSHTHIPFVVSQAFKGKKKHNCLSGKSSSILTSQVLFEKAAMMLVQTLCIFAAGRLLLLLVVLVEPPHVTAQAVLVPEHLPADFAGNESGLVIPVHISDVSGERVPTQLLLTVRTSLFLAHCVGLPQTYGGKPTTQQKEELNKSAPNHGTKVIMQTDNSRKTRDA